MEQIRICIQGNWEYNSYSHMAERENLSRLLVGHQNFAPRIKSDGCEER